MIRPVSPTSSKLCGLLVTAVVSPAEMDMSVEHGSMGGVWT